MLLIAAATIDAEATSTCRRQVFDLPPARRELAERRLFGEHCAEQVAWHVADPPTTALGGWNLSFKVEAICAAWKTGEASLMLHAAIADHVRDVDIANADETRHPCGVMREHTGSWWTQVLTTGAGSFIGVNFSRGKDTTSALRGEFGDPLVTDDLDSYTVVLEGRCRRLRTSPTQGQWRCTAREARPQRADNLVASVLQFRIRHCTVSCQAPKPRRLPGSR